MDREVKIKQSLDQKKNRRTLKGKHTLLWKSGEERGRKTQVGKRLEIGRWRKIPRT